MNTATRLRLKWWRATSLTLRLPLLFHPACCQLLQSTKFILCTAQHACHRSQLYSIGSLSSLSTLYSVPELMLDNDWSVFIRIRIDSYVLLTGLRHHTVLLFECCIFYGLQWCIQTCVALRQRNCSAQFHSGALHGSKRGSNPYNGSQKSPKSSDMTQTAGELVFQV